MRELSELRVLVVDDDADIAWGIGRYLARRGIVVAACGDGKEAIAELEKRRYDAVITDVQMPEVNGLLLLDWVRTHRPNTRVVVITAFGSTAIAELVKRQGGATYLEKPVDPDLIVRVLSTAVARDSFSGVVDEIDLFDCVQMLMATGRQAVLEVVSASGDSGRLYIERGAVRHASCGALVGEEAFFRCLAFESGGFTTLPWAPPVETTISRRGDHLLMDAARLKDEHRAMGRSGPRSTFPPRDLDLDFDGALRAAMQDPFPAKA